MNPLRANGRPVRYCKRCVEPDTRPDCIFDEEGVCLPCRYNEKLGEIDWAQRRRELTEIADWGRAHNVSGYDCIVPVSGGKDSTRQSLYVRDELGLKPLLVTCACPPEQQTDRGAHNIGNLISLGFDCINVNPGPETWRRLMRSGFFKWGNLFKSTELAIYAVCPQVAIMYHIPLLIYGENPSLSWGSAGGSLDGNANRLKYNNTLRGGDISWLIEEGFDQKDLYWYRYPDDNDIERAGLRMIYLGYYIPDFNDKVNREIALANGLQGRSGEDARLEDIGMASNLDALDTDFVPVNQLLKYLKLGFGRATEQLSGAIRGGETTRAEAVEAVHRYDGKCADRYVRAFCRYAGITEDEFWDVAESYRNRDLWVRDGNDWRLKYPVE